MPSTFPIPQTTLAVGTHDFGPANVADGDNLAILTIDRTPPGGFNDLTTATTCAITIWQSNDGGANWDVRAGTTFTGGIASNHAGQINSNDVGVPFLPGTGRQARAEVVIGGPSSVVVSGSLALS